MHACMHARTSSVHILVVKIETDFQVISFLFIECMSLTDCDGLCTGVATYTVDYPAQKVIVTGNVNRDKVLKRILKTGKHAELEVMYCKSP
jgi:hypothetical protein